MMRCSLLFGLAACVAAKTVDITAPEGGTPVLAECALKLDAGGHPHASYPSSLALPSGSCAKEPTCQTMAEEECASNQGPIGTYVCECLSGMWTCAMKGNVGAGICLRDGSSHD
jgi:hypothetical protein